MKTTTFEDWCEKENKQAKKKFQKHINAVPKDNQYLIPGCGDFVRSCQKFLNDRGYLTEKQILALGKWADADPYYDSYDYEDDHSYSFYDGIPFGHIPNTDIPLYKEDW